MSLKKENNKLQKYFIGPEKEHCLEFGFNSEGDFILIENFASWLNKDIKWVVQFIIDKSQIESLDEENRQYFDNLKKDIRDTYADFSECGFIAGLQIELNEHYFGFFSDEFEVDLQEKKINYTKFYNTSDNNDEKSIQTDIEKIFGWENHKIHMGVSPYGNMIFIEDFSNTTSYLEEPYEIKEIFWYVKFTIGKKVWDNLGKKNVDVILDYKNKIRKKYDENEYHYPAGMQIANENEFISDQFELTLQKLDIAYTKDFHIPGSSIIAKWF